MRQEGKHVLRRFINHSTPMKAKPDLSEQELKTSSKEFIFQRSAANYCFVMAFDFKKRGSAARRRKKVTGAINKSEA